MASLFYSDQYDDMYNDTPPTFVDSRDYRGKLRVAYATFTADTDYDDGDQVYLFKFPRDARVLCNLCYIYTDGSCTTGALDIGDLHDDDRYATALSLTTAGIVAFDAQSTGEGYVIGTQTGADEGKDETIVGEIETADVDVSTDVKVVMFFAESA